MMKRFGGRKSRFAVPLSKLLLFCRLQPSSGGGGGGSGSMTEPEDELTIPRAAMNKMIQEILPNIRVANEVLRLLCGSQW